MLVAFPALAASGQQPMGPSPISSDNTIQSEQILRELRAIRLLLEKLTGGQIQPLQTARLTNVAGFMLGDADAPLTMVEYTDLQCPYCREYVSTTFGQIKSQWIDTGKLRYIARDLPLDELHPQARLAARAARCGARQGKFWDARTALMRNANLLSIDFILQTANELHLDTDSFSKCLKEEKFDAEIQADMAEASRVGVRGTPTFIVGRSSGETLDGVVIVGVQPYSVFEAKFSELLALSSK